ncbi:glycosyltransferase family 4 protein [Desulfotomaculum sp. 1211_IL3151]|uniref:glycosyltransferase family 4 protein n=1 Tax=Desulfotomaculum sp. 1211_IL3151 TaxID=3084055 RepID=UPI002FDA2E24
MRIGIFTDSYTPYVSGVVRSIELFTSELKQLGHEVIIFAPNYPGIAKEENVYRFPSIPSLTNQEFYLAIPLTRGLQSYIKEKPLDIVHVHSPFILGRLGAKIAKSFGLPLVFTYHTLYDQYSHYAPIGKNVSKELIRKLCVEFCNRCQLVITPTEIISSHIKKMGVKTKVNWLPTGINLAEFIDQDKGWLKRSYGINPNEFVLLFVGRTGKEKNIPFLLNSFSQVNSHYPNTTLIIVGEGPEMDNLKKLTKDLALEKKVIFTGIIRRENLIKAYCGADLFVFASQTETQGLVIAEAKAAGLPTIAIDAFGVSNMIQNGADGFLVPPDIQLFSEKIINLMSDTELRIKMGQRALASVQTLSSQNCARKLEQYYGELIQANDLRVSML